MDAETVGDTERHDYAIHGNVVGEEGDQDNLISVYGQHVGRAIATKAVIRENKVSGKGNQKNHIVGPKAAESRL